MSKVKLDAKIVGAAVVISKDSFEHLLNCLDNQKFIKDINADAITCDYKSVQVSSQKAIDDFNTQCRELLAKQKGV